MRERAFYSVVVLALLTGLGLTALAGVTWARTSSPAPARVAGPAPSAGASGQAASAQQHGGMPQGQAGTVSYTLVTGGGTGKLIFVGKGGAIDGVANPKLTAKPGDNVQITLINGDGMLHDIVLEEFRGARTGQFADKGKSETITFKVDKEGQFDYFCSVPGHKLAGMAGTLVVGEAQAAAAGANIVRKPSDVPAPIGIRVPQTVNVELVAQEVLGQLADGTTFTYFTFNGTVPGPMFRARVGDTVQVHFRNETSSEFPHSVDFHAATGPGGGAVYSNIGPGGEATFTFKALNPGAYVYHCATPSVAHHIANGMYGMLVVEPEQGLAPVDREYYVMQGEIYTTEPFGTKGEVHFDHKKMLAETPEYFVFNGAAGALTKEENMLRARVGETVRLFVGVGGPNFTSSFHVIGEIFDRVYNQGSLTSAPLTDVQTTLIPAGGAAVVEFKTDVPGRYILVDHALSRAERGLSGYLMVEGDAKPEIMHGTETAGSGH